MIKFQIETVDNYPFKGFELEFNANIVCDAEGNRHVEDYKVNFFCTELKRSVDVTRFLDEQYVDEVLREMLDNI